MNDDDDETIDRITSQQVNKWKKSIKNKDIYVTLDRKRRKKLKKM